MLVKNIKLLVIKKQIDKHSSVEQQQSAGVCEGVVLIDGVSESVGDEDMEGVEEKLADMLLLGLCDSVGEEVSV